MLLEEVYTLFVKSTERRKKVTNVIGREKTLKRVNLIRWSARALACKSLRHSWDEVIAVLKIFENGTTENPVPRNEAKGIFASNQWSYFGMLFWKDQIK